MQNIIRIHYTFQCYITNILNFITHHKKDKFVIDRTNNSLEKIDHLII